MVLWVFDLDGTLVDSLRDLADSANALLTECGARALPEKAIGHMVGEGAATLVARAFAAVGVPQPPDALARFLAIYESRLLEHTRPYPGIPEALDALSRRSALAVLTNKPLAATRRILEGLNLALFFERDAVVGGDGPFPRKPDPSGLQHLMARVGAGPADTLLVGDSTIDWKTGRNANVPVCLVRYGFGFDKIRAADLGSADRIVDAPGDLIRLSGSATS